MVTDIFTAADMRKTVKSSLKCDGIDDWLRTFVLEKFVKANQDCHTQMVKIDVKDVKWGKQAFETAMTARGYVVSYKFDGNSEYSSYNISIHETPIGSFRD